MENQSPWATSSEMVLGCSSGKADTSERQQVPDERESGGFQRFARKLL